MNYNWNWLIYWAPSPEGNGNYLDMLLQGLQWTIITALLSWALAFTLGVIVGVMRTLPGRLPRLFGEVYVELFRNIPLLVQMFLWYFVLPELLPTEAGRWLKTLPNSSFVTATLCLGLYTSARVAVQVQAGIEALSRGQKSAGLAIGLTTRQTYQHVLLPVALRIVVPPLTSEFLNNLKNTSVGLTIGLLELTSRTRSMQEYSFQVFEAFTAATVIYLMINLCVIMASRWLEARLALPGLIALKK
jgi:glutamate/aspartate transport system permease protein